jgi:acetolactate synthase-1/2/3 large subunit
MTRNWSMPRPPGLVTVNVRESDLATNYEPDVAVLGDARLVLEGLAAGVGQRDHDASDLRAVQSRAWSRLRSEPAGAAALPFVGALDAAVGATDATVVVDMAVAGYWYGGYGRVAGPRRLQYPIGWGTLGFALPAAVGAGSAGARPVLAVCGDGGFLYAVGELAVLRQESLPVTVLVVDDAGYGMLRFDQDRAGDEHRGVDLASPDFAALAASFGIPAMVVESVDGLEETLIQALASRLPAVVAIELSLIPPRTTSPRWHD